jgi:colanic acid/amylovoran biosynthesis protein
MQSHIYIIGGGGIINKINTYSGSMYLKFFDMKGKFLFIAAFLAKILGAKTNFYAIGATSFPDPFVKFLAKFVLSRADVVSVRDPLSIKNLRELGIKRELVQVLDPGLSLEPAPPEEACRILNTLGLAPKAVRKKPLVGINIRYVRDPGIDNDHSVTETARLAEYLVREKQCDVLFLPISQHPSKHFEDDLDFGRQVGLRLQNKEGYFLLTGYYHPQKMMALLGEMDFLILCRLHAVILGSQMKVPILTVSYDNKVTQFVKLIGGEDMLCDLRDFTLEKSKKFLGDNLELLSCPTVSS